MQVSWTRVIVKYSMTGYDFDKGRKIQKLNTFETAETMPSQNRLALEHMLEYEDEPSEEFRSSLAALPVDLVSDRNQLPICKCRSCINCDSYNNANKTKHKKMDIILS